MSARMRTELTALTVGAEALRKLFFHAHQDSDHVVERVWVFRNTIDVLLRNRGLVTITAKPLKASFTVNIPWTEIATLPNGFKGVLNPGDVSVRTVPVSESSVDLSLRSKGNELTIHLNDAVVWGPSYRFLYGEATFLTLNEVLLVARAFGYAATATDSVPHPQILLAIRNAIKESASEPPTPARVFDGLLKLVGLGHGLTPSADDVVGGFAATINALVDRGVVRGSWLSVSLRELVSRTNLLSAIIMRELIMLNLNEGIDGAVASFVRGDADGMLESLIALLSLGHDSGGSMGLGCLIAACVASDADPLLCFDAFVEGAGLSLV